MWEKSQEDAMHVHLVVLLLSFVYRQCHNYFVNFASATRKKQLPSSVLKSFKRCSLSVFDILKQCRVVCAVCAESYRKSK